MPRLSSSAKWGKLFPTSSYFAGFPLRPPVMALCILEVGKWQMSLRGNRGQITQRPSGPQNGAEFFFFFLSAKLLRYWRKVGMIWKGYYQRVSGLRGPLCQKGGSFRQPLCPLTASYPDLASLALSSGKLPTLRSPSSWSDSWSWGRRCWSRLQGCLRACAAVDLSRWFRFSREARNLGFMNIPLRCKCRGEIENN